MDATKCIFELGKKCECLTLKDCKGCNFYKPKKNYVKDKNGFIVKRRNDLSRYQY